MKASLDTQVIQDGAPSDASLDLLDDEASSKESVTKYAGVISVCVAISRVTGFVRTWMMAFALGATFLSSSYQIANNLPNQLYELVMGGMLVTSFLPVYISVKKKLGNKAGAEYASNLFTLVCLFLLIISVLGMMFPSVVVYTQTFMSDQADMGIACLLFQFFAIQTVFYGASTIVSGVLNANREYLWSSAAPIFNNLIVIATFAAYAVIAPHNQEAALYVIAVGNPLGVFVQFVIQLPALKKQGIRLHFRINFKDPALKETLSLGIPALGITVFTFITVSVMNAASYVYADNGPSVIAYARLWYTLPYSFLAIPITTAMFTELSEMEAVGNKRGVVDASVSASSQIMFLLIPFTLYLIVFSNQLVTLYHTGAFEAERIGQIATFLCALSVALPFYGLSALMQKVFSSIRRLGVFAWFNVIASIVEVILIMGAVWAYENEFPATIETIGLASAAFYIVLDLLSLIYMHFRYGKISFAKIIKATFLGLVLGLLGAICGAVIVWASQIILSEYMQTIWCAFLVIIVGGLISLFVTFGIALKTKIPEASFIKTFVVAIRRRLPGKIHHAKHARR